MFINRVRTDLLRAYKNFKNLDENMANAVFGHIPIFRESFDIDDDVLYFDINFEDVVNIFTPMEWTYNPRIPNFVYGENGVDILKFSDPIIYQADIRVRKLCRKNRSKKRYPDNETKRLKNLFSYAYRCLEVDFGESSGAIIEARYSPITRPTREIILYMHNLFDPSKMFECIYYLFSFFYNLHKFVEEFDKTFK